MTSRATIGECAINAVPVATNQGFKNFVPFQTTDGEFLYYLLQTKKQDFISLCGGSTFLEIGKTQLADFKIALPKEKIEQTAIATILSDADALIESLSQLIAKKRQIKQGAMQELLTGKRRLPGFQVKPGYKQTEVGVIPENWEVKRLGEVADVIDPHPSHRAPNEVANGVSFVGIGDLDEKGNIIGKNVRLVSPEVLKEHALRYNLKDELIGLGRVASIGKVVSLKIFSEAYAISPTLGVIRGCEVKRCYLLYALKSKFVMDQFTKIMSGSTRSSVGMEVLRELQIDLPSSEQEQTAIATVLSDMDGEIAALEARRDKARLLKQGMMQELLTGRIRLLQRDSA